MKRITMFVTAIVLAAAMSASAAEVIVAAGAGYRKMVTEIAEACEKTNGLKVNMSFGNLGQIMAQVKTSGLIPAVVGDMGFFKKSGLEFAEIHKLGSGKLVLAWRKGLDIQSVGDIKTDKVKRLAIPNLEKAIYGRAGKQFLESSGMEAAVKDKLHIVATVPQVSSYLVTGEVDAGFSNLTDTMGVADKIGGYMVIEEGYQEISIVTGILKGHENEEGAKLYEECVDSDAVREIAKKHGL
jgi:molybdate transport system substrate-binding protein